jgi:hypothetical protein
VPHSPHQLLQTKQGHKKRANKRHKILDQNNARRINPPHLPLLSQIPPSEVQRRFHLVRL